MNLDLATKKKHSEILCNIYKFGLITFLGNELYRTRLSLKKNDT